MKFKWTSFTLLLVTYSSKAFKILVVSPLPTRSHAILGDAVVKHLSKAGHEIIYVTAYPREKPLARVKEINVSSNKELVPDSRTNITLILEKETHLTKATQFVTLMTTISVKTIEHPSFQKILADQNVKFDVIIAEWMYSDIYAGLSAVYQCPLIWLSAVEPDWKILRLIDEVPNPAYNSDVISHNLPPYNFKQRLQELVFQLLGFLLKYFYSYSIENSCYERILVPLIRERGLPVPNFEKLRYNGSLVLGNSHESFTIRLPSNYKTVGGYHIDENTEPLPMTLMRIMDTARNGVIYFSMGSILNSKLMPEELKQSVFRMFGGLKQTVLWKFEEDFENMPNNVHILHWAPQQSILAHPNCIFFITHGGLLSTAEAIYHAKPIIGIPVSSDHFGNVNKAVIKGFAKKVDLSLNMATDIKLAIEEVLGNQKYAAKAKELSFIYHHRPVHPGKELVHWVEHVVMTGGAPHLRSPALDVPLYQKLYLDLIAIIFVLLYIVKVCIVAILVKITCKKKQSKQLGQKKKKI